jgi:hypothetical protein
MIGSSDVTDYQCADGNKPYIKDNSKNSKIVAVVGGSYSSVTVQVKLLCVYNIELKLGCEFVTSFPYCSS